VFECDTVQLKARFASFIALQLKVSNRMQHMHVERDRRLTMGCSSYHCSHLGALRLLRVGGTAASVRKWRYPCVREAVVAKIVAEEHT
jgi:hypothetical protein